MEKNESVNADIDYELKSNSSNKKIDVQENVLVFY